MPSLPIYITEDDLEVLSAWLNGEENISIIVRNDKRGWIAKNEIKIWESGRYCLFHKLSGPLSMPGKEINSNDKVIADPFLGWEEIRPGTEPNCPYFGAGHPAVFWLNVRLTMGKKIGMSSFEWIGNHYGVIGSPAPEAAQKWWHRLRRWVKKQAVKIPRRGPIESDDKEVWTFSNAMAKIKSGVERHDNPI